jgi:hypothetical protein
MRLALYLSVAAQVANPVALLRRVQRIMAKALKTAMMKLRVYEQLCTRTYVAPDFPSYECA